MDDLKREQMRPPLRGWYNSDPTLDISSRAQEIIDGHLRSRYTLCYISIPLRQTKNVSAADAILAALLNSLS